jgi:hypothetical protein
LPAWAGLLAYGELRDKRATYACYRKFGDAPPRRTAATLGLK